MEKYNYIKDLLGKHVVSSGISSCYVYIEELMQENLLALRKALPKGFDVFYALKANPDREVVKKFYDFGCGMDVSSSGELKIALDSGVNIRDISFAGPGKTDEDIAYGVKSGIYVFSIENLDEIEKIEIAAYENGIIQKVSIRINPDKKFAGYGMVMGGVPSQFGLDIRQSYSAIKKITSSKSLELIGFHMHVGSQILSANIFGDAVGYVIEYALYVKDKYKIDIQCLNFGGGLGICYHEDQKPLDLNILRDVLREKVDNAFARKHLKNTRFIIEPGRFLIGSAGVYISKILYIKSSFEKNYIIIEGGMHHNMAASGNLGQVIRKNYHIDILRTRKKAGTNILKKYDIVGSLCTPLDRMAADLMLSDVHTGDYVCFFNSGAYGYTASPLYFLSHPLPEIKVI